MAERVRLDVALQQRGLSQSRARARDAILRGTVNVNGAVVTKPGALVGETDDIAIDDPAGAYVSRAALKLIAGLDAGDIDASGKVCLDLGASTGGFTQVLIERGAARVYAVDVGHGQLHQRVRAMTGVISMEGTNVKDLTRADIPEPIDLLVCDISFVSVTKVLAAPLQLCRDGADAAIISARTASSRTRQQSRVQSMPSSDSWAMRAGRTGARYPRPSPAGTGTKKS